jgi:catechol 2,3-dioxygenase-like lactoylglutathione lyase family enzyme
MTVLAGRTAGHVGINVTDLARSTAFYPRLLGLDLLSESPDPDRPTAEVVQLLSPARWSAARRGAPGAAVVAAFGCRPAEAAHVRW